MSKLKAVILVVEDHPIVRSCAAEVLVDAGFEALEAANSIEAIAMLEAHPDIHLVFTDAEMPGTMDGVKLAHHIRDHWPPVKLIIVSGRMTVPDGALPHGARFFPKPYRDTTVVEAMREMLAGVASAGEPS